MATKARTIKGREATNRDGWLSIGTRRTCVLDVQGGFYHLRREVEALVGADVADQAFYAAGLEGSRAINGSLLAAGVIAASEEGFRAAVRDYTESGFGRFRVDSLDLAAGRATITCPDAFESWAFVQNKAATAAPVCSYSAGVLAAAMEITGRHDDSACDEITCLARGDAHCTFQVLPVSESSRPRTSLRGASIMRYLQSGKSLLEEKTQETEILEQYRLLTENATDIIFLIDNLGIVTFISKRVESLMGYRPQDIIGRPIAVLLGEQGSVVALEHLERSLRVPSYAASYELALRRADGAPVFLNVSVSGLLKDGIVIGQQGIARDVTSQITLRQEVARRTQELQLSEERRSEMRDYVTLVTRAIEEERKRVARELHDSMAQALIALVRSLDTAMLGSGRPAEKQRLEDSRQLAEHILHDVRTFSRDLRPSVLDDLGLVPAVEWITENLTAQTGIQARLEVVGARRLAPDEELCLFRIVQEALSNVRRHSSAKQVVVRLNFSDQRVRLQVQDDGMGFVPGEGLPDLSSARGLGLRGMRERAELIGGQFCVTSAPGKGTSIEVTAPV